jgi:hypothetical protein
VVVDAVSRLVPGVIDPASSAGDSFATGLLEHPQYTRPEEFEGMSVPPILSSGNHAEVAAWRLGRRCAGPRTAPGPAGDSPPDDADRAERRGPLAASRECPCAADGPLLTSTVAAAPAVASLRQPKGNPALSRR